MPISLPRFSVPVCSVSPAVAESAPVALSGGASARLQFSAGPHDLVLTVHRHTLHFYFGWSAAVAPDGPVVAQPMRERHGDASPARLGLAGSLNGQCF